MELRGRCQAKLLRDARKIKGLVTYKRFKKALLRRLLRVSIKTLVTADFAKTSIELNRGVIRKSQIAYNPLPVSALCPHCGNQSPHYTRGRMPHTNNCLDAKHVKSLDFSRLERDSNPGPGHNEPRPQSSSPKPLKILGACFSTRAARVTDCFAAAKCSK